MPSTASTVAVLPLKLTFTTVVKGSLARSSESVSRKNSSATTVEGSAVSLSIATEKVVRLEDVEEDSV